MVFIYIYIEEDIEGVRGCHIIVHVPDTHTQSLVITSQRCVVAENRNGQELCINESALLIS